MHRTYTFTHPFTSESTPHPKSLLNRYYASAAAQYTVASPMCDKSSWNIAYLPRWIVICVNAVSLFLIFTHCFGHAILTPQFIQIWVACAAVFTIFNFFMIDVFMVSKTFTTIPFLSPPFPFMDRWCLQMMYFFDFWYLPNHLFCTYWLITSFLMRP